MRVITHTLILTYFFFTFTLISSELKETTLKPAVFGLNYLDHTGEKKSDSFCIEDQNSQIFCYDPTLNTFLAPNLDHYQFSSFLSFNAGNIYSKQSSGFFCVSPEWHGSTKRKCWGSASASLLNEVDENILDFSVGLRGFCYINMKKKLHCSGEFRDTVYTSTENNRTQMSYVWRKIVVPESTQNRTFLRVMVRVDSVFALATDGVLYYWIASEARWSDERISKKGPFSDYMSGVGYSCLIGRDGVENYCHGISSMGNNGVYKIASTKWSGTIYEDQICLVAPETRLLKCVLRKTFQHYPSRVDYEELVLPEKISGERITSLDSGDHHICVLLEKSNELSCFSKIDSEPDVTQFDIPPLVRNSIIDSMSASRDMTCVILKKNKRLHCWVNDVKTGAIEERVSTSDVPLEVHLRKSHIESVELTERRVLNVFEVSFPKIKNYYRSNGLVCGVSVVNRVHCIQETNLSVVRSF